MLAEICEVKTPGGERLKLLGCRAIRDETIGEVKVCESTRQSNRRWKPLDIYAALVLNVKLPQDEGCLQQYV